VSPVTPIQSLDQPFEFAISATAKDTQYVDHLGLSSCTVPFFPLRRQRDNYQVEEPISLKLISHSKRFQNDKGIFGRQKRKAKAKEMKNSIMWLASSA
jgi:hypothetical protein